MLAAKTYFKATGVIFFVVGCGHLLRLINGWDVVLGGFSVPVWVSVLGVCVAWFISYNAFALAGKKTKK